MLNYILENLWLLWTIIMFICLILELSSGDFFITCFAIGALVAVGVSFDGVPFWVQVVVWTVCSVLSIWLIRPRLLKALHRGGEERESNADALIGRVGEVVESIEADKPGYVKVDGDCWRALGENGETIAEGERVKIVSRNSIVVTVCHVS